MTQTIIKPTKETEQVYTVYLQLNPQFYGTIICVTELIEERVYNLMIQQHKLFTQHHNGVVQIGHTIDDPPVKPVFYNKERIEEQSEGVGIKIATAEINYVSDLIVQVVQIGEGLVKNGMQQSNAHETTNYFTSKPYPQLQQSLESVGLLVSQTLLYTAPNIIKLPYKVAENEIKKSPYLKKAYERAFLVPTNYTANYV